MVSNPYPTPTQKPFPHKEQYDFNILFSVSIITHCYHISTTQINVIVHLLIQMELVFYINATIQHNTTQHNTTQHNTTQHNTSAVLLTMLCNIKIQGVLTRQVMWQGNRTAIASHYEKVNLHVSEFFSFEIFFSVFFNVAKVMRKLRLLD